MDALLPFRLQVGILSPPALLGVTATDTDAFEEYEEYTVRLEC